MDDDDECLHFTLHLDKTLQCPVVMACWNPEKDLLAMVSTDHQLTVHRFNWQKLWAITPEKTVTSICWRPDGKALAAGYEDGRISLHDVENGEVIRTIETHKACIQCLYWVEENFQPRVQDPFEDRASRLLPPSPKAPVIPGTGSTFDMVGALTTGDSAQEGGRKTTVFKSPEQYLNVLCSGDGHGIVCLNAFGVFPIAKLELRKAIPRREMSAVKVMLSKDLCNMTLVCSEKREVLGISVDTSLLNKRHKEIRQVALQASSVEELLEVLRVSLVVMRKSWTDAIGAFAEKFSAFQGLLADHGSQSNPRDELLSLLACGSASASLSQFLAVSLGEPGLKRLAKGIDGAGKELIDIITEHLQPAAETITFRIGELLGLSRWRSQLQLIGLDQALVNATTEDASMLLVQVERFLLTVSDTIGQFRLFFAWLAKSLRQLNGETETSFIDSASLAAFLKSQFEHDPVGPHLLPEHDVMAEALSADEHDRLSDLAMLGGFKDLSFLQRTLYQQFDQLCISCRAAFSMPVTVISPGLFFKRHLGLPDAPLDYIPPAISVAFYEAETIGSPGIHFVDYTCFPSSVADACFVGILRGFNSQDACEIAALQLEEGLSCVDLALYKEKQLLLLLKDAPKAQAWIMVLPMVDISFVPFSGELEQLNLIEFCLTYEAIVPVSLKDGKARCVSHVDVVPPLAVSASRGLACLFSAQRHALLYDLEEDESARS